MIGERARVWRETLSPALVLVLAAIAACSSAAASIALLGGGQEWSAAATVRGFDGDLAEAAGSPAAARRALERAGARGVQAGELLDHSEVSSEGRGVLVVTVEADRPGAAQRLASAYAAVIADGAPGARASAARPAEEKSARVVEAALIGAMVGLVAGLALALVRERLDIRRSSSRALERRLGLERLGGVPEAPAGGIAFALPVLEEPGGAEAAAYDELALAVQRVRWVRAVLVTGTVEGDEGPRVAAGLGVALARRGRSVALVELGSEAQSLRRLLALARGPGLAEVLRGEAELDDALTSVPGMLRLAVLGAGEETRAGEGALNLDAAEAVLADLRRRFDVVIAAGPPLLDSARPPAGLDSVLVAVHLRRVRRSRRPRIQRALVEAGMPVLGYVLVGAAAAEG